MRIAVSGIGIISAIGLTVEQNLDSIKAGKSGLGKLSLFQSRHDFPVAEVKFSNEELKKMLSIEIGQVISRTALLGMLAAKQALDDADRNKNKTLRTGLISSTSVGGMDLTENFYPQFLQDDAKGKLRYVIGHDCSDSTKKIAAHLGITTFITTISTACSSAANAVILGAGLIKRGMLDRVVVGGTDALCKFTLNGFKSLMILDSLPCRPFDDSRAGLNLGEGAGYIVLQREDSLKNKPYAYLKAYANANDAFHQTASSVNGEGAYLAMKQSLANGGLMPQDIDYINIHGTGTHNNDASEAAAIIRIFGRNIAPFSSTKPFTGHTLAAAGAIEAVLSVMSIHKGMLYPNLNFQKAMKETKLMPCINFIEGTKINNVMSNSFGFGGNNSTLIFSAQ